MADLRIITSCSLDGYVNDASGGFDWGAPSDEVHQFFNDLVRPLGTFLLGRRMHEVLSPYWDDADTGDGDAPTVEQDFARVWQSKDKIVYSSSLASVSAPRTRLARTFDVDAVRALKESADAPLEIAGPTLAAHALRGGLVDEVHLVVVPVVVGGGTAVFPDDVRLDLELVDQRRFDSGSVHLHYRLR